MLLHFFAACILCFNLLTNTYTLINSMLTHKDEEANGNTETGSINPNEADEDM